MRRLILGTSVFLLVGAGFGLIEADRLDAGGASVSIVDFAFGPGGVSVPAGGTVSWSNGGETDHTVTASDGSFDSGNIGPGGGFSSTFATPGTFSYVCTLHPEMQGTVTVVGATPPAAPTPESTTTEGTTTAPTGPVSGTPTVTG